MSHFVNVKSGCFRNLSALLGGIENCPASAPAWEKALDAAAGSAWDNALWPPARLVMKP
jgi:hypothetical protein